MLIKEFCCAYKKNTYEKNANLNFFDGVANSIFLLLKGDRLLDIPCKVCGDRSSGNYD